jgi:hypothetical protein
MPESSSSSFIPKRGATQKLRQAPRRYNIFVLSIISYALFVAAPVASAAVYVYQMYSERQVTLAAEALQSEIASFGAAKFESVLEFDRRLVAAEALLDSHVSIHKVLTILERATAQSIGVGTLTLERTDMNTVTVTGDLTTDSFNAALFQRGTYSGENQIASTTLEGVNFTPASSEVEDAELAGADEVSFSATFVFALDEISYTPQTAVSSASNREAEEGAMTDEAEAEPEDDSTAADDTATDTNPDSL